MKSIIDLVFMFLTCQSAKADYDPTLLPQLIMESDVIVEGEIVSQDSLSFTIKITDWIKSDSYSKEITIQKFKNWNCANRISKYAKGQKEIVFLLYTKKIKLSVPMGAGNEGEFLIQNDSITYEDPFWGSKSECSKLDCFGKKYMVGDTH